MINSYKLVYTAANMIPQENMDGCHKHGIEWNEAQKTSSVLSFLWKRLA